jgi:two-component system, OmpR family, alkaline phosphatase synthesis response regulator PhoP
MNQSGRILIIDDEASLRQTLARILQRAGHEVTTAESGEMGLAILSNATFDLVYMDIRMPGMAGLDALKTMHASQPNLPVVLFTAQPDMQSAVEALRLGATDYLLKPLQPQVLLERTHAILSRQERERRKQEIQSQIQILQSELKNLDNNERVKVISPIKETDSERFLSRGKFTLDLHARRLTMGGRAVELSPTAFDYLLVLVRHTPNVVNAQTLVVEAQGYQAEAREAQELAKWHIHHIRQALEPTHKKSKYIINVRGSGYRFVPD